MNDWTARELAVKPGDTVTLDYYVWQEPGVLETRSADFKLVAVVPIAGAAADRDLAPAYPGISDADTLGDWDPPFPIDLKRVRPVDEDYWKQYRTTPKAFIPFEAGRGCGSSRYGDRTSFRILPAGQPLVDARAIASRRRCGSASIPAAGGNHRAVRPRRRPRRVAAARPTSASTSSTSVSSSSPRRSCSRRSSSGSAWSSARARSACCARSASARRACAACSPRKDCCSRRSAA